MKRSLFMKRVALIVLSAASSLAVAQSFPSKPLTLIAPFAPGASADGIARIVARELSVALGQSVVVENRPGGGGATGLIAVAKATADGHTLGIGATGAITIGPHLPDAAPLNPQKQLEPLAKIADIPLVLVAGRNAGFDTLGQLLAKARASDVSMANSGQYTAHHLSAELLASMSGAKLIAVPYRGSAPAVNDILGGQLPVAVVDLTAALPHIKAGTIKALAVTSAGRTRLAPDIPTMAEAGVAGYAAPAWMGLFLPKGVPAAVTDRLSREIQAILAKADVQNQILALAAEPAALNGEQFASFINGESARWAKVITELPKGAKP